MQNNSGSWTVDGQVSSSETGRERNHNGGFLTDSYGGLVGGTSNYTVAFTGAYIGTGNLWTYRVFSMNKSDLTNFYPVDTYVYELAPRHASNLRLDVAGAVDSNGINVQVYETNSNDAQKWKLKEVTGGYFELIPQSGITRRLDVYGAGTSNGTNVQIWETNGNYEQQWRIIDKTGEEFELSPRHAQDKRLDVAGAGTSNGTNVQIYESNENQAQQWEFIYISSSKMANQKDKDTEKNEFELITDISNNYIDLRYTPKNNGSLKVEIFDLTGRLISEKSLNYVTTGNIATMRIPTNNYSKGIYIINLVSGNDFLQKKIKL
ncbi:RICIN domain-containing protein [Mariniflexile maritimum]|uniref:RICIN domain-containing protein n=1 Tax=Mariniflexile maritimum TaxID=2682493 RepID=UPI0012F64249|nr:RICIN domain-containing protein [Mariniflexile maritimum]